MRRGGWQAIAAGLSLTLAVVRPTLAADPAESLAALVSGAEPGGEIIRFAPAPGGRLTLALAARVPVAPATLISRLGDPSTYRRAVPAFARADVLEVKKDTRARLIAWELEIPLWNLEGRLWLHERSRGVRLQLVSGDLAPGQIDLEVFPAADGTAALVAAGAVNFSNVNFVTRRLVARDRLAEPAMTAAALVVLLRALALEATRTGAPLPARQPSAAMAAPPASSIDIRDFQLRFAGRPDPALIARVRSRRDGRLDRIEITTTVALPAALAATRLTEPERWRRMPGWTAIEARAATPPVRALWRVQAGFPFVDFDATWSVLAFAPFRAEARAGDWLGALIGVDLVPASPNSAQLFLTLHPRLDRVGFLPRKLIEAEPLLEHGLGVGLALVDARALGEALLAATPPTQGGRLPAPAGRTK